MQIDMNAIAEIIKDKVGRKQIITLATIVTLAWIGSAADKELTSEVLVLIAIVGVVGIVAQSVLDWFKPRKEEK